MPDEKTVVDRAEELVFQEAFSKFLKVVADKLGPRGLRIMAGSTHHHSNVFALPDAEVAMLVRGTLDFDPLVSTADTDAMIDLYARNAESKHEKSIAVLSLTELTRKLSIERKATIVVFEMRKTSETNVDAESHSTLLDEDHGLPRATTLEALCAGLREVIANFEADLGVLRNEPVCRECESAAGSNPNCLTCGRTKHARHLADMGKS